MRIWIVYYNFFLNKCLCHMILCEICVIFLRKSIYITSSGVYRVLFHQESNGNLRFFEILKCILSLNYILWIFKEYSIYIFTCGIYFSNCSFLLIIFFWKINHFETKLQNYFLWIIPTYYVIYVICRVIFKYIYIYWIIRHTSWTLRVNLIF